MSLPHLQTAVETYSSLTAAQYFSLFWLFFCLFVFVFKGAKLSQNRGEFPHDLCLRLPEDPHDSNLLEMALFRNGIEN
jgi:hypothetical protein